MSNKKVCCINFYGPINHKSMRALIATMQHKLQEGTQRLILLISSPGGEVAPPLSAYNFLKGIPAEIETHVYGVADSMATVLFCTGVKRRCVPHARFFLHGVGTTFRKDTRFEAKQLDERMKSLRIDIENIARILAENCNKSAKEIEQDMLDVRELNASQAQQYGLVHEIKSELYPAGADIVLIAPE